MFNFDKSEFHSVSFPGLGIGPFEVNPVALVIGSFEIRWYAVIITLGIIFAVAYAMYRARKIGLSIDDVMDYAIFLIPSGIIGARLYYVLSKPQNFDTFWDVINLRSGGIAIYGALIGGAIACLIVSKVKKVSFFAFGDCVMPGILLAQGIGRWGNFMNQEAFGSNTTLPWGMTSDAIRAYLVSHQAELAASGIIVDPSLPVHPTFLYESLWNILGFILIHHHFKHRKYDGQVLLITCAWYGLGRMMIEGLRTDSLYILGTNWLRTSQLLAAIIFIACTTLIIVFAFKRPKKEFFFKQPKEKKKK